MDRVNDLAVVASWQVGAADAAGKQRVAGNYHLERQEMEADRALRVSGRVEHLGWVGRKADLHSVGEALVWRGGFRGRDAQPRGLLSHHLEQGQVIFVEQNGSAGETLEAERSSNVVDMGMSDKDLFNF